MGSALTKRSLVDKYRRLKEGIMERIVYYLQACGYSKEEAAKEAEKMISRQTSGLDAVSRKVAIEIIHSDLGLPEELTQFELDTMLSEEIEKARKIGIQVSDNINPSIKVDKATSRFGCCKATSNVWEHSQFTVCISQYHLKNGISHVRETIAHEVLHTVKEAFDKGHGLPWKTAAAKMNMAYGYQISRLHTSTVCDLAVPKSKGYEVYCPKCGTTYHRSRRSNLTEHPELYRCGHCGEYLKLRK